MINEEQTDALKEYMNQFIGQAASLLSDMVDKKVQLMIPDISLVYYREEMDFENILPRFLHSYVVSSSITFGEQFSGEAKLIFPKEKIKDLVQLCLDEEDSETDELTDTDFDAITEIGNIILNAVVGSIGNLVEVRLDYTVPEIDVLNLPNDAKVFVSAENVYLLIIRNSFTIDGANIEGAIIVMLSMESINELVEKINEILVDYHE
ncbi:hypothetical protein [Desulfuribacillus alkaliarsenatis]|uniref:Chemotaxis protein CheC n=1 Tax=Desulfuribacillus alkaliarsenatis TaxID=766136 RepID=A0A1E5G124_9FIRM|nr:hypothetical protein [Desulfuribacillus alkaliarsenatis]OEF96524.1 hypothetical protein BHF68_07680 [Desulfuribacillus alkaliarsenatis]